MDTCAAPDTSLYNRVGAEAFLARMAEGAPLVMQGPTGTVLMSQPGGEEIPAAAWNLSEPQTVERVHALYEAAGADALITNSFQASAPALARDSVRQSVSAVNRAAVDCARCVGTGFVLGSMGSCCIEWIAEDSPSYREARAAYREQAHALLAAGADGLLLETFVSLRELQPALAGVADVADGMPFLVSFAVNEDGDLLGDGQNIEAAAIYAAEHGAAAVGVNCCSVAAATAAVPRMAQAVGLPLMVRPNAGNPHRNEDGRLVWDEDPLAFAAAVHGWVAGGACMVGSCCGTTALTTCALAGEFASA